MGKIQDYFSDIQQTIQCLQVSNIERAIQLLHEARLNNQQIFVMGNGGSASTASHFVCDLLKNTRAPGCVDFRVIGLSDNMALMTSLGNDEGYENVFAGQMRSLVQAGDIVVAISTSGNSPNVLVGVELANQAGATTIGFTGKDGGKLADMVHLNVHVPNERADQVEDIHMILAHMISWSLKEMAEPSALQPLELQLFSERPAQVDDIHFVEQHNNGDHRQHKNGKLENLLKAINNMGKEPEVALSSPDLLSNLLLMIVTSMEAISGSFMILNEEHQIINAALAYGGRAQSPSLNQVDDVFKHGLAGWVVEHKQSALLVNNQSDHRWLKREKETPNNPARSVICIPLILKERVVGVLTLSRSRSNPFQIEDLLMLTAISTSITTQMNGISAS